MAEYYVGQIFIDSYPTGAADFCNEHNYCLNDIEPEDGHKRYQIQETPQPTIDVDKLTMTAWDFVRVLKVAGLSSADILEFLNANPDIQLHLTCCQNVYCGVAKSLMPITYKGVTITAEMVEQAFRDKYGA